MKEKIKKVESVIIEIKPSLLIPGEIGLFAARTLPKNTIIADANKLDENFFPWSEYKKADPVTKKKIKDYCLQTPDGFYAPDNFNYLMLPWNMNHCCSYNVGFDDSDNFVTTKKVKKGEELTWDYGMGISDPKYKLVCKCKSSDCRGLVTGNDWKNIDYVNKNRKYFMRELLK